MSGADAPQGPGWWQASDGKWYAPEQISASQPPVPPAPAAFTASPTLPTGTPPPAGASGQSGFFGRLFDVSMKSFITPSIIKVLFVLGIIAISLATLLLVVAALQGDGAGFLLLIAPVYWFLGVLYLRVILEVIVVLFRIEENTRNQR